MTLESNEAERIAKGFLKEHQNDLNLPQIMINDCQIQIPILVEDLEGQPSYWFAPVSYGKHLVGFIRLSLQGELLAYGRFGQGKVPDDFPPLEYISKKKAQKEIQSSYSNHFMDIDKPKFVHDGPLGKIAWMARARSSEGTIVFLFWSFGYSYFREANKKITDDLI